MASIQGSINSMIGSASHAIRSVKTYEAIKARRIAESAKEGATAATGMVPAAPSGISPQQQAAAKAQQSVKNAIEAKKIQRRNFMDYLSRQPSSLGTVGDLDPALQKKIAASYSPSMRKRLMDAADREAKNGKHR